MRHSDEELARRLYLSRYIRQMEWEVWQRNHDGETLYAMRHDYPNDLRPGKFFWDSTLKLWVEKVNKAIEDARLISLDVLVADDRIRYKIAVAQGHDVHDASNPTPQLRVVTEQSTWNTEQLRAAGFIDRYSRKRA
jgi:hypothetical protein